MANRYRNLSVGLSLLALLSARPSLAQQATTEDLKRQMEALGRSVAAMQKDLVEIKALLRGRVPTAPPQNVVLELGNAPSRGEKTAKVTLVEFSDYQCTFCSRYARETFAQIDKEYIQTGRIRYVVMSLPLESIHKSAFKAAEAAGCAAEQGKFWEMHARLLANQQTLDQWAAHAEAVGIDVARFGECLNSGRQAARIRADMAEAQKAGVTGTPAFLLAYATPKAGTIRTVTRLVGAQPYDAFKAAIDKLAESPGAPGPAGTTK